MERTPLVPAARRRAGRRQRGSAYLLALLVLVVLSLIGLSLALVTQTEQQIGATEKEAERAFYAADSGIAISTAFALNNDRSSRRLMLNRATLGSFVVADRVQMSPFSQISFGPCNFCQVNQGKEAYRVNSAVTAWESRQTKPAGTPDTQPWTGEISQALLGVLINLEPTELTIEDAQYRRADPETNALVRY